MFPIANRQSLIAKRMPSIFGTHEPTTLQQLADVGSRAVRVALMAQLEDVASRARRAALMADGHLGYVMPIGGVAAYREQVSVVGVGFDIACGNAAIRTNLSLRDLGPAKKQPAILTKLADEIAATIRRVPCRSTEQQT